MYTPTRNCPYQMARRGSAPRGSENLRRAEVTLFSALARFSCAVCIFLKWRRADFVRFLRRVRGLGRGFLQGSCGFVNSTANLSTVGK